MPEFRVIDLRSDVIEPERIVTASTPQEAAFIALGETSIRAGQKRNRPICRVYWKDSAHKTNMVRLYRPLEEPGTVTA